MGLYRPPWIDRASIYGAIEGACVCKRVGIRVLGFIRILTFFSNFYIQIYRRYVSHRHFIKTPTINKSNTRSLIRKGTSKGKSLIYLTAPPYIDPRSWFNSHFPKITTPPINKRYHLNLLARSRFLTIGLSNHTHTPSTQTPPNPHKP